MSNLVRFVFSREMPLWRYCLIAGVLAFAGSLALSESVEAILTMLGVDVAALQPAPLRDDALGVVLVVIVAPLVESLLLALTIIALGYLMRGRVALAVCAALVWASLHALAGPLWFFGVLFSFFIFSMGYLTWRPKSLFAAYLAAAIPHVLLNMAAMLLPV